MSGPPRRRLLLFWYGAGVFLSASLLLVLEIVAGRLLHESGTPLAEIPRLTDDFTPVEKLIAPLFASQAGL
ncbi:MAG: hypothetical protein U9Q71_07440 [Pseudomonadota bacterium]|nr:hypothetical protein [Pseudomonadota bacterium]